MIGVGSRVRYQGPREEWQGRTGKVITQWISGNVDVEFDQPWSPRKGTSIFPTSLVELIVIDPNRPVRFKGDFNRPCTLIGTMPNGDLVVTSVYGNDLPWTNPMVFNRESGVACDIGCSLVVENVPLVESQFYPLGRQGVSHAPYSRGMTVLAITKSEYPDALFFVEIISTDGVPTEAKIHAR